MVDERSLSLSEFSVPAKTALMPLVARAQARTLFPELGFVDERAEHMVEALGIPLDMFGTDPSWLRGSVLRAKWFDDRCRQFFDINPGGLGVALGAGLDTRFERLKAGTWRWVDVDLHEVISLKRRFVRPMERYRALACDVTDLAWIEQIRWHPDVPIVVVAEGLLMYLATWDVRRLLRGMATRFSGGTAPLSLLFDYASPPLALSSWAHPALRHTEARFRWGLARAGAIRLLDQRYQVVEDYDVSQDCGYPTALISMLYQLMTLGCPLYGLAHLQLQRH